jgi:hypothetical protein
MTPEEYERKANTLDAEAEWHDAQADWRRKRAQQYREIAAEDHKHPPSQEERIRRILNDR